MTTKSVLRFCLQISKTINELRQTHARLLRTETDQDQLLLFLTSKIIHFSGYLHYARKVFEGIPHCENQYLWTSIIRSHSLNSQFSESLSLYAQMHRRDVVPSTFTFSSVLSACARLPAVKEGKQTHTRILVSGLFSNKVVQTALLDMYSKFGDVSDARSVFDTMSERDIVSWTAMISGYAKGGLMEDAGRLFDEMPERNVVSWTTMVAGYAHAGDVTAARKLFDQMPERNAVSWTAMIAGYGKCGDVTEARRIFEGIAAPDPTAWAAMVASYAQNGFSNEAIEMYKEMRQVNVKPNEVAIVGVISACTQLGDADVAEFITNDIEDGSSKLSLVIANALIHMYAKCGNIDRAHKLFNRMNVKDIISYSALITGLADHGRVREAIECFKMMQRDRITPNQVTFIGVLNACSYAGKVDEGCKYFEMMTQTFKIVPLTEHFACMVDLLGRAGRLSEALRLIENIDGASDAGVWGALLGACRVHCNVEMGEIAARRLFEIEPENTGNYVLLSNIYASLNRWDDAEKVRKMMNERRMTKSPGRSWVSS